jgi:hypothetical protein
MLEAFRAGGFGMIPTCIFGLILLCVSVRYARRPEARVVPLLVSLGLLTNFSGLLGFVSGIIKTMEAVGQVQPGERFIALIGLGESAHNLALAFLLCSISMLAVTVGAWRLARAAAGEMAA